MIRGTLIGQVWATRQAPGIQGRKLVLVAARDGAGAPTGRVVVAIDTLDAAAGQDVTVAFGSAARNVVAPGATGGEGNRGVLCDAAIAALVEGTA